MERDYLLEVEDEARGSEGEFHEAVLEEVGIVVHEEESAGVAFGPKDAEEEDVGELVIKDDQEVLVLHPGLVSRCSP